MEDCLFVTEQKMRNVPKHVQKKIPIFFALHTFQMIRRIVEKKNFGKNLLNFFSTVFLEFYESYPKKCSSKSEQN